MFVARGDVFTAPIEKGPTRNLTKTSNAHDKHARWSPDGEKVLYTSTTSDQNLDLFLLDLERGNTQQLTQYDGVDLALALFRRRRASSAFS